ncbi:MAG TPA: DUF5946 family protein [Candidatus Paceibacterota bacterium]
MSANLSSQEAYNELSLYTLARKDASFIHQHIVDAFTAQNADEHTKPIALTFALVGLYLYIEKGYTGKEVQRAHMELAEKRREWPRFALPDSRGEIAVFDVLDAAPGDERDRMIDAWCRSVWAAYAESHAGVAALVDGLL